jgi:hypothetical protein
MNDYVLGMIMKDREDNPIMIASKRRNTLSLSDDFGIIEYQRSIGQETIYYYNYVGSCVEMPNRDIWLFWGHDSEGDTAGDIYRKISRDGGKNWGNSSIFAHVSGHRLWQPYTFREKSTAYVFWTDTVDSTYRNNIIKYEKTTDSGSSWEGPYTTYQNDGCVAAGMEIIKHRSLYLMSVYYQDVVTPRHFKSYVVRSTSLESRWTKGADVNVTASGEGAKEPSICVLSDDRIMMDIRVDVASGHRYKAYSSDDGASWITPTETDVDSPDAMGRIFRCSDGGLVRLWSNCSSPNQSHRYPYAIAYSKDDFATQKTINIVTETASNQLSNMGNLCQLVNGKIIVGHNHYEGSTPDKLDLIIIDYEKLKNIFSVQRRLTRALGRLLFKAHKN